MGRPHGQVEVGVARAFAPVSDVLADRRVEEERLLRDDCDLIEEGVPRDVVQRDAIDFDAAALGLVEAQQQVDEGRLALACPPHDGDYLTGLHSQ